MLCLDVTLTSPPVPGNTYDLFLRGATSSDVGAKISLALVSPSDRVVDTGESLDELQPTHGFVTVAWGLIGVAGDDLSLLIDRRALPSPPSFSAFDWSIDAYTGAGPSIEPYDCAPTSGEAAYPPGTTPAPSPVAHCVL